MAAKDKQDKLERGELVVAVGPFCVPCGKRFAKQTVYDAHLSGKKHLAALQRMGRHEEAMVCQLDVEAKRRKMQEREDERLAAAGFGGAKAEAAVTEEDAQLAAERKAEREKKLLERSMMPMPSCVTATSVYSEGLEESGEAAEGGAVASTSAAGTLAQPTIAAAVDGVLAAATATDGYMAAAGAGTVGHSYTGGTQDGTGGERTNRHTTSSMAASHRRLVGGKVDYDWLKNVGAPAGGDS